MLLVPNLASSCATEPGLILSCAVVCHYLPLSLRVVLQEDNLRAGLLLEQAAYCLLSLQPAHKRKFAFHLVLAGLRYDMCEQKFLSRRAYT